MRDNIVAARLKLMPLAKFIERHDLLAKFYILLLSLILILPRIGPVRLLYYAVVIPMFLLVLRKDELNAIARSPIVLLVVAYFFVFVLVAPFADQFDAKALASHIRSSILVVLFLATTALLVLRNPKFPASLVFCLALVAAVVGLNNVWRFYRSLPPDLVPWLRLQGVPGITMYYNSNWISQLYGIICVAAVAIAAGGRLRPSRRALLIGSAIILFACVLLTQTRSVLIGVVAGIAVTIVLGQHRKSHLVILLAVAVGVLLVSAPYIESLITRGDPHRRHFWLAYLDLVWTRPWAGYGLSADLAIWAPDGTETTHPHNIVYHALLRGGMFAMLALVALLAASCWQALRAWRITNMTIYPSLMVAALIPLQLEFTVFTGTSVGWDWIVLWMPIGLCIGANLLSGSRDQPLAGADLPEFQRT
jgi:O-antigen ligase